MNAALFRIPCFYHLIIHIKHLSVQTLVIADQISYIILKTFF